MANMTDDAFLASLNGVGNADVGPVENNAESGDSFLDSLNGVAANENAEPSAPIATRDARSLGFAERHGTEAAAQTGVDIDDAYGEDSVVGAMAKTLNAVAPFAGTAGRIVSGARQKSLDAALESGKTGLLDGIGTDEWDETEGKKYDLYQRALNGDKDADYSPIYARKMVNGRYVVDRDENGNPYLDERYATPKDEARKSYVREMAQGQIEDIARTKYRAQADLQNNTAPWHMGLAHGATSSLGFAGEFYLGGALAKGVLGMAALRSTKLGRIANVVEKGKGGLIGIGKRAAYSSAQLTAPTIANAIARYENLTANDYRMDKNGNVYLAEKGDGAMRGAAKAIGGAAFENVTEVALGKIANKVFGATCKGIYNKVPGVKKLFDSAAGKLAGTAIEDKAKKAWVNAVKTYATVQKAVHFELMPVGEFAEEYVQGYGDDVLGFDNRDVAENKSGAQFTRDFFDWDAGGKDLFFGVMGQTIALGLGGHAMNRAHDFKNSVDTKVLGTLKLHGYSNADIAKMGTNRRLALSRDLSNGNATADMGYAFADYARFCGVKERDIERYKDDLHTLVDKKKFDALDPSEQIEMKKNILQFNAAVYSAASAFENGIEGATDVMNLLGARMKKAIMLMEERQGLGNARNNAGTKPTDFASRVDWTGTSDGAGNINWQYDGDGRPYIESRPLEEGGFGVRIIREGDRFRVIHPQAANQNGYVTDDLKEAHDWAASLDQFAQKKNADRKTMKEYVQFNAQRLVPTKTDKKTGDKFGAPVVTANNAQDALGNLDWLTENDRRELRNAIANGTEGGGFRTEDGTVLMLVDNLRDTSDALLTLSHELGGHMAIKEGADAKNLSLADTIAEVYDESANKDANRAKAEYRIRRADGESKDAARAAAQEEGMVYGNEYRMPVASPLQKVKTAVKAWMKKHGMDAKMTDADYDAIAASGLRRIRQTRTGDTNTDTVSGDGISATPTVQGTDLKNRYENAKWIGDYYAQREKLDAARAAVDAAEAAKRNADAAAKEQAKIDKAVADEDERQRILAEQEQMRKDAEHATQYGRDMVADVLNGWYGKKEIKPDQIARIVENSTADEIREILDFIDLEMDGKASEGAVLEVARRVNADIVKRTVSDAQKKVRDNFVNRGKNNLKKLHSDAKKDFDRFIDEDVPNGMLAYMRLNGFMGKPRKYWKKDVRTQKKTWHFADSAAGDALDSFFDGMSDSEKQKWERRLFGYGAKATDVAGGDSLLSDLREHFGNDNLTMEDVLGMVVDEYAQYEEYLANGKLTKADLHAKAEEDREEAERAEEMSAIEEDADGVSSAQENWGAAIAIDEQGRPIADAGAIREGDSISLGYGANGEELYLAVVERTGDMVKCEADDGFGSTMDFRWNKEKGEWEYVAEREAAVGGGQEGDREDDSRPAEPQAEVRDDGAVEGKDGGNGAAAEAPSANAEEHEEDYVKRLHSEAKKRTEANGDSRNASGRMGIETIIGLDDSRSKFFHLYTAGLRRGLSSHSPIVKAAKIELDRMEKDGWTRNGKNEAPSVVSEGKVANASSFSRSRVDNIVFRTPFVGKNGAKLVAYSWKNKNIEEIDGRGEDRVRKISDWEESLTNPETNRDIVHHFTVVDADGKSHVVSAETAAKMLGVNVGKTRGEALKQVRREMKLRDVTDAQKKMISPLVLKEKDAVSIMPDGSVRIVGFRSYKDGNHDAPDWPIEVRMIAPDGSVKKSHLRTRPDAKYFATSKDEILGTAEGSALTLDGGTAQEIAAEEKRNRDRKEIQRRMEAPLKTGKGEMGQSLMDLVGAEGEDLFNRTANKIDDAVKSSKTPQGRWRRLSELGFKDKTEDEIVRSIRETKFSDGETKKVGAQSIVYRAGDKVVKLRDTDGDLSDALDKIKMFNSLFPDMAYSIREEKTIDNGGKMRLVLEQPYVDAFPNSGTEARKQLVAALQERFGADNVKTSGDIGEKNLLAPKSWFSVEAGPWHIEDLKDLNLGIDSTDSKAKIWDAEIAYDAKKDAKGKAKGKWRRNTITQDEFAEMESHFGTTTDAREGGYILPNGKMLDFSGAHWTTDRKSPNPGHRAVDHRDIYESLPNRDYERTWDYVQEMMDNGAMRMMPEGPYIGISTDINAEQEKSLAKWILDLAGKSAGPTVEIFGDNGVSIGNLEYAARVNPKRVIADIHKFFADKTEESADHRAVSQFHGKWRRSAVTPAEDAAYMDAVKRGDMETARRMVREAAAKDGYDTPKLYRGTSRFGYTKWNDGDIIFTTDSESRASGYGGPGNGNSRGFSRSRNVSYKFNPFYGNNYVDLIKGAKEILGADVHIVGNNELEKARNDFRELFRKESDRIDDAQNKVKNWADIPEEYRNDFETVVWFFHNLLQDFDSFANGYGQMRIASRNFAETIMESRNRLRDAYESGKLPAEYNPIFDVMFKGYEYGDAIIDALYGYSRTGGDRDVHIANSKGEFIDADELGKEVDLYSGSGIMNLVGRTGANPLVVDCNGAYWTNIKVDAIDGKQHSTDFIVKWARDNGYTSVILKNVMDPGIQNAEGSDYIFFNSNDVKSADPVTYDDAGNVIPLSERFNAEKSDIRWRRIGTKGASRSQNRKEYGDKLLSAMKMLREGEDREKVWRETGWWRGRDGKWRLDVNDDSFAFEIEKYHRLNVAPYRRSYFTIGEILDDENFGESNKRSLRELVSEYPEVEYIRIETPEYTTMNGVAEYEPKDDVIRISPEGMNNMPLRIVHEMQHAIQWKEGFKYGKVGYQPPSSFDSDDVRKRKMKDYLSNLGEIESYIAEIRYGMDDEYRKNTPPWEDEANYISYVNRKTGVGLKESDIRFRRRTYTQNLAAQRLADLKRLSALEAAALSKMKNAIGANDMAAATKAAREIAMQGSVNAELKTLLDAMNGEGSGTARKTDLAATFARRMLDTMRTKMQDSQLALKQMEDSLGIKKEDSAYYQSDRNFGIERERMDDLDEQVMIPLGKELAKLNKTYARTIVSKDRNGNDVKHREDARGLLNMLLLAKHGPNRNRMMAERSPFVLEAMTKRKARPIISAVLNGTRDLDEATIAEIGNVLGWTREKTRELEKGLRGSGASTAFWNKWLADNAAFARDAEPARQLVMKMNQMTRDILVKSGRLSATQASEWERLSPDYVPMRSDMEVDSSLWAKVFLGVTGDGNADGAGGHGYADNEFHHAYGRNDIADDPIAFSSQQYADAVRRSLDNDARRKLADIVRNNAKLGKVFLYLSPSETKDLARRIAIMRNVAKKRALSAKEQDALNKMTARLAEANIGAGLIPTTKALGANGVWHEVPNIRAIERDKANANDQRTPFVVFKEDGDIKVIRLGGFTQEQVNADRGLLSDSDAKTIATQVKKQNLVHAFGADTMRKFTGLFAALRTAFSPYFVATNLLADRSQAKRNIYATFGSDGVKKYRDYHFNSFGAARAVLMRREKGAAAFDGTKVQNYAKEWAENGGRIAGMAVENIRELGRKMDAAIRRSEGLADRFKRLDLTSAKDVFAFLKDAGVKASDFIEYANSVVEMSTRIAAYATARDMGYSIADAVSYSRDITVNFNRKGEWTPTINAYIAFSNAGMQDLARSLEAFGEGEKLKGTLILGKRGAMMATKLAVFGFISALIGYWQDDEKDEREGKKQYKYNKEWEKANKMGIRVGDHVFGIPIRGLARIPYYFGHKAYEVVFANERAMSAAWDVSKLAMDTGYDVFGGSPTLLQAVTPSVFKPAMELVENKDFSGRQIYREPLPGKEDVTVKSELGRGGTADGYKSAARLLNRMTGGTEYKPGAIDIQPEKLEKVLEWIGGTAARDVAQSAGFIKDLVTGDIKNRRVRNMPLLSRFVRSVGENSADYYGKRGEYEMARKAFDGAIGENDMDAARESVSENPWLSSRGEGKRWGEELKTIASDIRELMKAEKTATGDEYERIHAQRLKSQYQFIRRLDAPPSDDADGVRAEREHHRSVMPFLRSSKKDDRREDRDQKRRKRLF